LSWTHHAPNKAQPRSECGTLPDLLAMAFSLK